MATQENNILLYDKSAAKYKTLDTGDTLKWSLDTIIDANLTVTGETTTVHSETVLIKDNFLDLNHGYSTNAAQQGGVTVNYDPDTSATTTSTAFTAGSGSGPVLAVASNSGFANYDVIQVSDATDPENDGIYIIKSISSTNFTLMGTGGTAVPAIHSWAKNQLTTNASDTAATVIRVAVSIMKADTSGDWQVGKGSNITNDAGAGIAYSDIQTGTDSSDTLQAAYVAGATITTTGNDLAFTLSSGNFTASGAGSVDLTPTSASQFTSGGALTFTAGAASTWSTTAGALTIDSAGVLTMDTNGTDAINLGTEAVAKTITVGNAASTEVEVNAIRVDINAAANGFQIDGAGNSNLSTSGSGTLTIDSAGALTIDTDGTDAIDIGTESVAKTITIGADASTKVDLNALAIELDSAGTIVTNSVTTTALTATTTMSVKGNTGASFGDDTGTFEFDGSGNVTETGIVGLTLAPATVSIKGDGSSVYGDDVAQWTFDGAGAASESGMTSLSATPSGAITLTGGAASTWSTSAGALTLTSAAASTWSTAAGALTLSGASGITNTSTGGTYTVNAAGQTIDMDCTTVDVDCTTLGLTATSGGFAIDSTGSSRVGVTGANLNLKTTTSGNIELEAAGYVYNKSFISVNGDNPVTDSGSQMGIRMIAGEAITQRHLVYMKNGGLFTADASAMATAFATGCAFEGISNGSWGPVASIAGSFVNPLFDSAPATSDLGARVYLSETAGKVTLTPPTTSGSVQYQVGHLIYRDGTTTANLITWLPQFLAEVP